MFFARRPSQATIDRCLRQSQGLPLSYASPLMVLDEAATRRLDEAETTIGSGRADFDRARAALLAWKQHELGWIEMFPDRAPVAVGTVVAMLARHLGFWSLNTCRILHIIDTTAPAAVRFGFVYGALTNHAVAGEELFEVSMDAHSGAVRYRIRAVSWPQAALTRIGRPITRAYQARFRRESAGVMARVTRGPRVV